MKNTFKRILYFCWPVLLIGAMFVSCNIYNSFTHYKMIEDQKNTIPIAKEYFINTKDKLLLLRMGEFADIGLNCYYNHELKDMCVSFIKEHEDANKRIYTLEDPKLREILPQEEIDGLIYLTTPSENGCSYSSICISIETDYFGANISTDESSFWVDDRYAPMARQGDYYIEKLDDEYYIQIVILRRH